MENLMPLVRGYFESAGFRILRQEGECLVADKLLFGQDRDTWVVWTVPSGRDNRVYEPRLRAAVSSVRPNYPEAKAVVVVESRGGFSRELLQDLAEFRVRLLVPIQFFDTPFKVDEAPGVASAISDIRSLGEAQRRVAQPFCVEHGVQHAQREDLFDVLRQELTVGDTSCIRFIVGRAGIGKSFLFRSLFAQMYEDFVTAKTELRRRARPIPLLPDHLKGALALRTEALVDSFLESDVASPVRRETFEWLLVNGFTTWLLDGLDELYAGDPDFFGYLSELLTQAGSKAQIVICCRDSLLTTSDEFMDFQDLWGSDPTLRIYRLSEWGRTSKRQFAWLGLEARQPQREEADTERVAGFLRRIDATQTLASLSGLPLYCDLLLQQYRAGDVLDFGDDVAMLNHVIDKTIQREVDKGLLDLRLFVPRGLDDWLEQMAVTYLDAQGRSDISRDDAILFGQLVLSDEVDEEARRHLLLSLLNFPLFQGGTERRGIAFAHELIAEALAARAYVRQLNQDPATVAARLGRVDLEDPTILRFMAPRVDASLQATVTNEIRRGGQGGRACAVMLSLLMLARPERDLLHHVRTVFNAEDLAAVRFDGRDLSGMSFRNADLSHAVFRDCDLRGTHFEGAFLYQTRFEGRCELEDAGLGDGGRVRSAVVNGKLLEVGTGLRRWIAEATGRPERRGEPCPTACQIASLFGKFVTRLGKGRRDNLKYSALVAGRRHPGAAATADCIKEVVHSGYLIGPDDRHRYRRAAGGKYAEMVKLVRDESISEGLGMLLAELCRKPGCVHQIRP